ncbi:MAG: hypothetical protein L0H84_03605 [Pseudonocardia sp.]|nr:hypothetical protein [Pseudonocardia sp.]
MRTTVEISERQHAALSALAQRRRLRGFSQLVQEALDAYLADLADDEVGHLLNLEGSVGADEEAELRSRIKAVRESWRAS